MSDDLIHWSVSAARKTMAEHGEQKLYTVASGITPSGTIHIGNFREVITVDLVKRGFELLGKPVRHIHSWDNYDVFRKVPKNMPQGEMLQKHLRKCIIDVPDPFGEEKSYAAKHIKDVEQAISRVGIKPEFLYQAQKYQSCEYAEEIKKALVHTKEIKEILDEHRKEPLSGDWLPVAIFCDECKKDTISVLQYKGEYTIHYECECGHKEDFDFREKGIIKLLWRIDWPMRWSWENVNFEPGGKDHSTAGGSYDTGKVIVKNIWNATPPSYLMYDFIQIKGGGGKISSSTGDVVTLQDVLEIYEPEIVRYLFAGTRPNAEFAISFDADVIKIFEDYDKCERIYYGLQKVNDKEFKKQKIIYILSQIEKPHAEMPIQISFRHLTTIAQINQGDVEATLEFFRDKIRNKIDEQRLRTRIVCVNNWLKNYADEQFTFTLKKEQDIDWLNSLDEKSKKALHLMKEAVMNSKDEEELSTKLFDIPKSLDMQMNDFFTLAYQALIGKNKGPKLAPFIIQVGKERILRII